MFVDRLAEMHRGSRVDQFLHNERGSIGGDVIASIPIMMAPLAALAAAFTTNPELQAVLTLTAGFSLVATPCAVLLRVFR